MRIASLFLLATLASQARAQVPEQIPPQEAGATDWFGAHILRIRGGTRVEVAPHVASHILLVQLLPQGILVIRQMDSAAAGTAAHFDLRRPTGAEGAGGSRVPFTVTVADGQSNPMGLLGSRAPRTAASSSVARDGIIAVVTDVALDSAEVVQRLTRLPMMAKDSLASQLGRLLVGRSTSMWAAYYATR